MEGGVRSSIPFSGCHDNQLFNYRTSTRTLYSMYSYSKHYTVCRLHTERRTRTVTRTTMYSYTTQYTSWQTEKYVQFVLVHYTST